jgi:hypothetical protein
MLPRCMRRGRAAGVRTGYVPPLGLIVSGGCDRLERHRLDSTAAGAPFEGAAGMQDPLLSRPAKATHAYRVGRIRHALIASARWNSVLHLKLHANES